MGILRLSMISFTGNGKRLSEDIAKRSEQTGLEIRLYTKCRPRKAASEDHSVQFVETSVGEWARAQMRERNALLFIGACGIAVRAVAPYLADKLHDSPVLVMDEKGRYVIPILSGHMGGANELAVRLAAEIGAEPVITTATDLNEKFAADLFAKQNGLAIINKEGIARVSAKVLAGEEITMSIEENMTYVSENGILPPEVRRVPYPPDEPADIVITSEEQAYGAVLLLKPKKYVIGLGCKKGKTADEIDTLIRDRLDALHISLAQILALASITHKQKEQGVIEWCRRAAVPFLTYTAEDLQAVEGDFGRSEFVRSTVGVDNVCERAALKACGAGGKLVSAKCAENGITIAIAAKDRILAGQDR